MSNSRPVLLRSLRLVCSVLNRSPSRFLHEIILVDDCSDNGKKFKFPSFISARLRPFNSTEMLCQIEEMVFITGEGERKFDALRLDEKENKYFKMLKELFLSAFFSSISTNNNIIIIIINFLFTVGIKLIIAHTLKKSELIKTNYLT